MNWYNADLHDIMSTFQEYANRYKSQKLIFVKGWIAPDQILFWKLPEMRVHPPYLI